MIWSYIQILNFLRYMSSKKNKVVLEARDGSPNREKLYKRFKKLNGAYGVELEKLNTRS